MKPQPMKEFTIKYVCGFEEQFLANKFTISERKARSQKACPECREGRPCPSNRKDIK